MDIRVIRSGTVHTHAVEELPALAADDSGDGLLWVDCRRRSA
ncbi:hypothetical protein [Dactylosporangium sp. NPDC050588]